ncbi:MAG TPA: hypothetical protein PLW07_06915, partial [bacterium]|nr:hypothetical protein [bacterium]
MKSYKSMTRNYKSLIPSKKEIGIFRRKIIAWFEKNGRVYPWRQERDPFRVLVAEMMLRRTKADQVVPVYKQFLKEFPDVDTLAEAKQEAIEKILYPLGLKWRIPAFGLMAQEVREKYHSKIPEDRKKLMSLPGVGEYVTGAVLSIAYGKNEWAVDSNIVRIFKLILTKQKGEKMKKILNNLYIGELITDIKKYSNLQSTQTKTSLSWGDCCGFMMEEEREIVKRRFLPYLKIIIEHFDKFKDARKRAIEIAI